MVQMARNAVDAIDGPLLPARFVLHDCPRAKRSQNRYDNPKTGQSFRWPAGERLMETPDCPIEFGRKLASPMWEPDLRRSLLMIQRTRDLITQPLTMDYLERKSREGWTPSAIEWVRELPDSADAEPQQFAEPEEVPYGYRISPNCKHLEPDPSEMAVLALIMEKVVQEWRAPQIALELNRKEFRTRRGGLWSAAAVFDLLPRLVDVGPRVLKQSDWPERRRKAVPPLMAS